MQAIEEPVLDPRLPGSTTLRTFSGIPWWLVGITATIALTGLRVLKRPKWREGFAFISNGQMLTLIAQQRKKPSGH